MFEKIKQVCKEEFFKHCKQPCTYKDRIADKQNFPESDFADIGHIHYEDKKDANSKDKHDNFIFPKHGSNFFYY